MSCFEESTQRNIWLLSKEEIVQLRKAGREKACARIEKAGLVERELLNEDEERLLRCYYEKRIVTTVRRMRLPTKTAATAVTYFKRFFLKRSIMDYNPRVIALSCLYASFKVEETVVDAETLCERSEEKDGVWRMVDPATVLSVELNFLESLGFQLICFHPYRSLDALVEQLVEFTGDLELVYAVAKVARELITSTALYSDLQFLYPPARIALGAMKDASQRLKKPLDLDKYLYHLVKTEGQSEERLRLILNELEDILVNLHSYSKYIVEAKENLPRIADLEQRRHACSSPDLDPESEVYKRKEQAANEKREMQQARKAKKTEKEVRRGRAELTGVQIEESSGEEDSEELNDDRENNDPPSAKRSRMSIADD